jgi:hypothetical protein
LHCLSYPVLKSVNHWMVSHIMACSLQQQYNKLEPLSRLLFLAQKQCHPGGTSFLEASLWPHSAQGCVAAIRHRGSEGDWGVVFRAFLVRSIPRLVDWCFGFRPVHIDGWSADWERGSAVPGFFYRTRTDVEVCRAKFWFSDLYLKFSCLVVLRHTRRLPRSEYFGVSGPLIFFMGESLVQTLSLKSSRFAFKMLRKLIFTRCFSGVTNFSVVIVG